VSETSVYTFTFTQTATYLADTILGSVADIVAALGLKPVRTTERSKLDHAAVQKWIEEKSLRTLSLEFSNSSGDAVEIFEFGVTYGTSGTADFYSDQASLARYRVKLKTLPSGSTWRMVCYHHGSHTEMPGWSPTTGASTAGMRSTTFGTIGSAPGASSTMRHLTR
jgi:hypothetical protein